MLSSRKSVQETHVIDQMIMILEAAYVCGLFLLTK